MMFFRLKKKIYKKNKSLSELIELEEILKNKINNSFERLQNHSAGSKKFESLENKIRKYTEIYAEVVQEIDKQKDKINKLKKDIRAEVKQERKGEEKDKTKF